MATSKARSSISTTGKLILAVICTLLTGINCFATNNNQLTRTHLEVGWELWYPYQFRDKQGKLIGLDIEIFEQICQQAKVQFNLTELPWKRHLLFVKSGKMDMAMGASKTAERTEYAWFTQAYRQEAIKLFVKRNRANQIQIKQLNDIINSDYLIGIEGGYFYGDEFAQLNTQPKFQQHINEVLDIEQNVSMLLKNRIDGLLADPVTMKAFVEKYHLQGELIALPFTVYQSDIHLMLSKKSMTEQQLQQFNQAISVLKNNGAIEQIINKYSF